MNPLKIPFERQNEEAPLHRNLGEVLRSQIAQAAVKVEKSKSDYEHDFVSLVVESNSFAFYMGNVSALFLGELPSEPQTVEEALTGPYAPKWKQIMDAVMQTLLERGTWDVTELPPS